MYKKIKNFCEKNAGDILAIYLIYCAMALVFAGAQYIKFKMSINKFNKQHENFEKSKMKVLGV